MDEVSIDSMIALAEEALGYAEEEFRRAVLKLFRVLYWFIGVDVRKPQTPPNTSIQRYKLQPKHHIETSPR